MMRFGTQTGSLVNHVMSMAAPSLPAVGDGATLLSWSDRHPATVIAVFKHGKYDFVQVQMDNYTRTDKNGISESQEYDYTPNPQGSVNTYRLRNDKWEAVRKNENGRYVKTGSDTGVIFGRRERYYDFSH